MMKRTGSPKKFLTTIYKIWMMRHVDVPEEVAHALAKRLQSKRRRGAERKNEKSKEKTAKPKYIPVLAIVNGKSARVTLVPTGGDAIECRSTPRCARRRTRTSAMWSASSFNSISSRELCRFLLICASA